MKIQIEKKVIYSDINSEFKMRVASLFRLLQDAAITHSTKVGYGPESLYENGFSWILSKIALTIRTQPKYGDIITVNTWSRKIKGFRAYREFEICCNGECCATATSLWAFVSMEEKKIRPIPQEVEKRYTIEPETVSEVDLDAWKPSRKMDVDNISNIFPRYADFDTNKHVNNSVYFDYIEDHFVKIYGDDISIKTICLQYLKEIASCEKQFHIGSKKTENDRIQLKLYNDQTIFGVGEILV